MAASGGTPTSLSSRSLLVPAMKVRGTPPRMIQPLPLCPSLGDGALHVSPLCEGSQTGFPLHPRWVRGERALYEARSKARWGPSEADGKFPRAEGELKADAQACCSQFYVNRPQA